MSNPVNPFRGPAPTPGGRNWAAPALPRDPGLDELLADPALCSTAKTIAAALVKQWAWSKDHCWPSDATVAGKVGRSVGHVQRCMRRLEQAGWVRRERTDEVPNGRRIWLLWRCEGGRAGARPGPAPARDPGPAPARDKQVVIVNGGMEQGAGADPRRPRREDLTPVLVPPPEPPCPAVPRPLAPVSAPAPTPPDAPPGGETPAAVAAALRGLREALAVPHRPAPPPPAPPVSRRNVPGLKLTDLAAVAGATADPILAAEVARRSAPPPPPEPPPQSLTTAELLARLPGRHDLIAAAADRLATDTGDLKSWGYYQRAALAVASRSRPAAALLDCWRQATGPSARRRGAVFATAWKREAGGREGPPP